MPLRRNLARQLLHEGGEVLVGEVEILHLGRVMQQVVDNEHKHDASANQHIARGVAGAEGLIDQVAHRPRGLVLDRELGRRPNVQDHHEDQTQPRRPDQLRVGLQEVAVAVDRLRAKEDLQVAGQMPYHEQEQGAPCHRHDILLAE